MRLFGIVTRGGFDPFSLAHALDCFWEEQKVLPNEPLVVYEADPAFKIVKAWGEMKRVPVVDLPEGQDMVRDYAGCLLVGESLDLLPPDPRDGFIQNCVERATAKGLPVVTLICEGCPV